MRLIITGSAAFAKYPTLSLAKYQKNPVLATTAIEEYEVEFSRVVMEIERIQMDRGKIDRVLTCGRPGVEEAAAKWALSQKVPVDPYKPIWKKDGVKDNYAGYNKTLEMINFCSGALVLLSGDPDKHLQITINELKKANRPFRTVQLG